MTQRAKGGPGPGSGFGMPVPAWPRADREAFAEAFATGGFLEPKGRATHMAPATRISVENAYARWLAWLRDTCPSVLDEPPAERATYQRVLDYLHGLQGELALRTICGYGCRLKVALEVVLAPDDDWSWMVPILQRIDKHARNQQRPKKPIIDSGLLWDHGIAMMSVAGDHDLSTLDRAECFRNGLLFAFLAACPLRRTNMIGLVVGQSLVEDADGYRVCIAADDYKTRTRFECPLPAVLVPYMDLYLQEHRPVLAAGPDAIAGEASLWLSGSGAPLTSDTFAGMISRETLGHFGQRLTPHDFRHCAATTIAITHPDMFLVIKTILGHATCRTAEQHYIHAQAGHAGKRYQKIIMARRAAARPAHRRRITADG